MKDGAIVTLEPKTRNGRNKVARLRLTLESEAVEPKWVVLRQCDRVHFDSDSGPWLMVRLICDLGEADRFIRWVHATRDKDFAVHEA